ncbi:mycofactocin-coupled SDR family oxidoreductase [Pseudonocardia pini]|uniref:mycofactocin-coupled SDR family oxidoreductase n=1 Tax=Pseudonocardia pini TaxID=2758030 RepID=UPI0015EFEC97|nr:mycofactocin-coupled SDR family oxidoreductase [Pseudonocardia pini]
MTDLTGRVALVTGAARGQGRSHAVHLAAAGADVVALDICAQIDTVTYPMSTPADLAETARLVEGHDRRCHAVVADVRDSAAVRAAVDTGVAELGRLDVVVANAGISGYGGVERGLSDEAWRNVLDTNLTGAWHTCAAAIPHMADGGSIVLTSSVGGLRGIRNLVHYTAAKHGLTGLMRTLALEHAHQSIRVNLVHPTAVNTPMIMNEGTFRTFRPDLENPGLDDVRGAFAGINALPVPWVEPADVSKAVLFLASDDARYITGATLPVDAGALLR